jgi:hypothetical protein
MSWGNAFTEGSTDMGDRSPKAAKKHADQKQVKSDRADRQKRQDVAAKQQPPAKKK